jgi:hypothetical protein
MPFDYEELLRRPSAESDEPPVFAIGSVTRYVNIVADNAALHAVTEHVEQYHAPKTNDEPPGLVLARIGRVVENLIDEAIEQDVPRVLLKALKSDPDVRRALRALLLDDVGRERPSHRTARGRRWLRPESGS